MASPFPPDRDAMHHWIRVSDKDLAYILDGPSGPTGVDDWIDEVIDIVEDGLETV